MNQWEDVDKAFHDDVSEASELYALNWFLVMVFNYLFCGEKLNFYPALVYLTLKKMNVQMMDTLT